MDEAKRKKARRTAGSLEPHGSAWASIVDANPEVGQIIACTAEHRDGGPMYWAGLVTEVRDNLVIMQTRGERTREFAITPDTLWCPLPNRSREARYPVASRAWLSGFLRERT